MNRQAWAWKRVVVVAAGALMLGLSGSPLAAGQEATPVSCPAASEAANKAAVGRWWDEIWSTGDTAAVDAIVAENLVHHWALGPDTTGSQALKDRVARWRVTFPDMLYTYDVVLAEGDLVAGRWTATATNEGDFMGTPATGKVVSWSGINIFRFECGKIVEVWSEMDVLGLQSQLTGGEATPEA